MASKEEIKGLLVSATEGGSGRKHGILGCRGSIWRDLCLLTATQLLDRVSAIAVAFCTRSKGHLQDHELCPPPNKRKDGDSGEVNVEQTARKDRPALLLVVIMLPSYLCHSGYLGVQVHGW